MRTVLILALFMFLIITVHAQAPQSIDIEAFRHELTDPLNEQIWNLQKRILFLTNENTRLKQVNDGLTASLKKYVTEKPEENSK